MTTGVDKHFWYFESFVGTRIFDARDAELANNRFTLEELKQELHNADIQQAVSKSFGEDQVENYWFQYKGLVELLYYGRRWIRRLAIKREEHGQNKRPSIEEIKEATDIVDVISPYVELRKMGKRLYGLCPFHNDHHPSFYVDPEKQQWHCFGACNNGGDVIDFLKLAESLTTTEAITRLVGGKK